MHSCLPVELLVDIIEFFFEPGGSDAVVTKPPWSRIHPIILTSRTLRAIGLKLWFARLRVRNEFNWEYISNIPGIYNWVRVISYHNVSSTLIPSIHPTNFPSLECVSIRMLNIDRPTAIIDRLPRSIKRLEVWKFDTMVHDHLFSAIGSRLPDLRELRVHGIDENDKFGLGMVVDSAEILGRSMASSLSKLQKLEVLSMDAYLTPSAVLLRHTSCQTVGSLMTCETCTKDYRDETNENEMQVSFLIADALESLKTVEWCSCFRQDHRSILFVKRDQERTHVVFG